MAINYISRDYGVNVSIVRITSSDSTATCLGANYITNQAANIAAANYANNTTTPFSWFANDCILLSASDGLSLCSINSSFTTLSLINLTSQANLYGLNVASFTLTAAQFNGMYATPVEVLAAQGAGTIIIPDFIAMELVYGSAQFADGGPVGFQYGNTDHLGGTAATGTEQASDFTGATSNTVYQFGRATGNGSELATSAAANAALYISNSSAAFETGTGATFNGTILYRILPVV